MIATEAGAEGINLQFCSLVVNYDLPWNPQRIEQRIGRCHRYGQEHDVVVVNFLNQKNAADQRVFVDQPRAGTGLGAGRDSGLLRPGPLSRFVEQLAVVAAAAQWQRQER